MTGVEVVTVQIGHPRYEDLLSQIRDDEQLLAQMWADAEHHLDEMPGKRWTIATADGVPVAWCAARVEEHQGVLVCSDNYERRGLGRARGLFTAVYRHRHDTIVRVTRRPAVTYLFAGPLTLHEADGWYRTGARGTSHDTGVPHEWWELRRDRVQIGAA